MLEEPRKLNDLLTIFNIHKKSELRAHCKTAVITGTDLANLILAAATHAIPIIHVPTHRHYHPKHLNPTEDEMAALGSVNAGPVAGDAAKFFRKIDQTVRERRLFNAHYFAPVYHPSDWHLFYWDQRDTSGEHWQGISHIHLINMLTHPRLTLQRLSDELLRIRPHFAGGLHIRFRRDD